MNNEAQNKMILQYCPGTRLNYSLLGKKFPYKAFGMVS